MPPHPIYNELSVPEASISLSTSSPTNPESLQTHSNKFPIEREVIITTCDKNSKIPILHDYVKRVKGTIAPDIPPKQTAAWTQEHIYSETNFPATLGSINISERPIRRENTQNNNFTKAAQAQSSLNQNISNQNLFWENANILKSESCTSDFEYNNTKSASQFGHENLRDEMKVRNKNLTKTYHAIKDIISNKFRTIKDNEKKSDEDLNNTTEEVKKNVQETYFISNAASSIKIQYKHNQDMTQKHLTEQNMFKSQDNRQPHPSNKVIDKYKDVLQITSEKGLTKDDLHPEDAFASASVNSTQHSNIKTCYMIDEKKTSDLEHFQFRRTLSQPHLMNTNCIIPGNLPQPQTIKFKHSPQTQLTDNCSDDRDYDTDFSKMRVTGINSKGCNRFDGTNAIKQKNMKCSPRSDTLVDAELRGFSRKKLECEIGDIQGVYTVGLMSNELFNSETKINSFSPAKSDYERVEKSLSTVDSDQESMAHRCEKRLVLHVNAEIKKSLASDLQHSRLKNDPEWVDIVEGELRNILKPRSRIVTENSTISESISSMTPPLPPLSPGDHTSPIVSRRNSVEHKPNMSQRSCEIPHISNLIQPNILNKWYPSNKQKHKGTGIVIQNSMLVKQKQNFGLDAADITSNTTRSMDLESLLDIQSESDADISSYGAHTIRKQLEGLEGMYTEVLKLLGVKKTALLYQPSDPRFNKRRNGSVSSLQTSSLSSRPVRDRRRSHEEWKKLRDMKSVHKRFQRLESHVVTLARSVAHLSSEMRTQHLMIQEMENIRSEISTLRTHTNMLNIRSQSTARSAIDLKQLPALANPTRVKKLTNFFGDEPPLLRLFLRNMGYEKYASLFEKENIGMIELPYFSEERLQKLGIPLGPRLRIMEEAQMSVLKDNTLCIV